MSHTHSTRQSGSGVSSCRAPTLFLSVCVCLSLFNQSRPTLRVSARASEWLVLEWHVGNVLYRTVNERKKKKGLTLNSAAEVYVLHPFCGLGVVKQFNNLTVGLGAAAELLALARVEYLEGGWLVCSRSGGQSYHAERSLLLVLFGYCGLAGDEVNTGRWATVGCRRKLKE